MRGLIMAIRSRQKIKKPEPVTKTGIVVKESWCRKCMQMKKPIEFFEATDVFLDSNGLMSICKDCLEDMFNRIYQNEHSMQKAIYRVCKLANIKYDESAYQETLKTLEDKTRVKTITRVFGAYKVCLRRSTRTNLGKNQGDNDLTFSEPISFKNDNSLEQSEEPENVKEYLNQFWGTNFSFDNYNFLEKELSEWKKTHKCDTKAEESLLKELCYKELEIRNARVEGISTATLVKEKQDLMKTASVDPAKTALAGSGRSQDTFSSFIKIIEETEPAEYFQDKALFKDFDGIDFYFKKYVTRPLSNFLQNSRDFNVDAEDTETEENEDTIEEFIEGKQE